MKKQTCPYLGMQEDPTTALDFPSEGNFCHRAEPTSPVNKIHQQRYCLTAGHYGCPVYRAARPEAMPPALLPPAENQPLAANVANRLPGFLLPGIVLGIAVLGLVLWIVAPQVLGIDRAAIPNTGDVTPGGDTSFNLFKFGDTRDETWTPFAPQFRGQTGEMVVPNCPQPDGWIPYITNPTDSLFRLSVVYGVPVEDLQRANCKDTSDTVILPGQVIYVPATGQGTLPSSIFVQEPTAFPTFTPARPGLIPQATSTSSGGGSAPDTPVPSRTPTKRATNTPLLPTATRVTATPTRWVTPTRPTATPTRFVTPTKPTATLRPTNTPRPTLTPTPQPTNTRFPTRTPRPTRTRQPTRTPTPVTPTNTPVIPTDTPEPTNTPRPTDPPPTNTPRPTDPPPTNTPRPTDPPPTNTPRPTDPPPTDPPPTDTPQPTDPPPTDPPPTDPPPTEEPPPTSTDPPPVVTEPVRPTETDPPPDITEPPPEEATPTEPVQPTETDPPPDRTEPPPEEATPTDPVPPGSTIPMGSELF